MATTHPYTCMLCEAMCGVLVEVEDNRAVRVRGDENDPFSRGHVCPKVTAIEDIRTDPDRVRTPLRRKADGTFEPIAWDAALALAGEKLGGLQRTHGREAVGVYIGNPVAHNPGATLGVVGLIGALQTRQRFSANSTDGLPHILTSFLVFGNQALLPVPDIERTDFFLVLGANPVVSNGSLMSAPGAAERIKAIRARGGRVVVVDPRRSETAALADTHLAIRPGTDAFLLATLLQQAFARGGVRPGRLEKHIRGLDVLREAVARFTPALAAEATGLPVERIERLATDYLEARTAVAYGRLGLCTQAHGGLAAFLVVALNTVTGRLDTPGGSMFAQGPVDLSALAAKLGQRGSHDTFRSRVRGLPEVGGELPVVTLPEEIETPGPGQIRGLVTVAGNPVLSAPDGRRLERALPGLEFMVSVDIYINETTRHADLILPTHFGYERDHHDIALYSLAVRNGARYAAGFLPAPEGTREEMDLLLRLGASIARGRGGVKDRLTAAALATGAKLGPRRTVDLLLRTGPRRLSVKKLLARPEWLDLGPLEPRLPTKIGHPGGAIELAPDVMIAALRALERPTAPESLTLIGRRLTRSNNSWMHNSRRLTKGRPECTLLVHPDDATSRGLTDGGAATLRGAAGHIRVTVEISDEVAPGVVCLPHGFGHGRDGSALGVASRVPGESVNDVIDVGRVDPVSGIAAFSGTPVEVTL